jgi:hypothetical protein
VSTAGPREPGTPAPLRDSLRVVWPPLRALRVASRYLRDSLRPPLTAAFRPYRRQLRGAVPGVWRWALDSLRLAGRTAGKHSNATGLARGNRCKRPLRWRDARRFPCCSSHAALSLSRALRFTVLRDASQLAATAERGMRPRRGSTHSPSRSRRVRGSTRITHFQRGTAPASRSPDRPPTRRPLPQPNATGRRADPVSEYGSTGRSWDYSGDPQTKQTK